MSKAIITDIKFRGVKENKTLTAKFRYRQKDVPIQITWLDDTKALVEYTDVKAVTPGQACVFYDGEVCLGSGFIDQVFYNEEERKYS